MGDDTPAAQVWARPGMTEMASPASTETLRASLRRPPTPDSPDTQGSLDSPRSPIKPHVLFSMDRVGSAESSNAHSSGDQVPTEEMAPHTTVEISAEGYADDTYMLALCALALTMMLQATGQWTKLTGQEINVSKSLTFSVQHRARGTLEGLKVELNNETLPQQHEPTQPGIGVRMRPRKGMGTLLEKRVTEAQKAPRKSRSPPLGFGGRAAKAAVMIIAAALYGVELADISKKTAAALEATAMHALWGPSRPCRSKEIVFVLLVPAHWVAPTMVIPYTRLCWLAGRARTRGTP